MCLSGRRLSAARAGQREGAEHRRRGEGKARLGRGQSEGLRNPVIAIKKEKTLSVIFIADRVFCAFRAFGAHLFLSPFSFQKLLDGERGIIPVHGLQGSRT